MSALQFPPLFSAMATAGVDPFVAACEQAKTGCDAGLVTHDIQPDTLRAAIVFAPEVALSEAVIMLPLCGVGFQNAFGAIAPPEVSVHLDWNGAIRVNGAVCGTLTMAAAPHDPEEIPDWLVVGLNLSLWTDAEDTGLTPDVTSLFAEGCSEVDPTHLLEAWVRHTLVWINRWNDDGVRPLHNEWTPLAHGLKDTCTAGSTQGLFFGVDENFGMILKSGDETRIIPLTQTLLETP